MQFQKLVVVSMKNKLPQYLKEYMNDYLLIQKNFSVHTISSYKYTFNELLKFCINIKNMNIKNITLDTFEKTIILEFLDYLENAKENSIATRNNRLKNIKAFLKYIYPNETDRILQFQKVFDIPLKKDEEKPMEYMTVDVLELLLKQPNLSTITGRRDLTLLATLYDTGARVSELINLKVRDVKFDNNSTTIKLFGKGSKTRIVPIISNTEKLLKQYLKEHNLVNQNDNYIFFNKNNKPLTKAGVKYIIEKYRALAEKESPLVPQNIFPHMFRHTKAMHLLESGVNYIYIRDFLGHSNVKTTEIYARISVQQKKRALDGAYKENIPIPEENSWNKDEDLLTYLMKL